MKKRLLMGASSVVMMTALSGPAMAAEKIQLQLGGKMEQYFGGVRTFNDGGRKASSGFGVDSDTEVYFTGITTLDNGVTIRARIELEAEANDTDRNSDEQYVDISGNFGMIRIGEKSGVFDAMAVRAPNGGYVSQQDIIDWLKPGTGRRVAGGPVNMNAWDFVDLEPTLDNDTLRLSYMSPQFYGFTVGASFAPNAGIYDKGDPRVREGRRNSNEVQMSLAFDHKFDNGLRVRADGAFATTINGYDMWAYRGGLGLAYGNFKLSGGYLGTSAPKRYQGGRYVGNANPNLVASTRADGLNKGGFDVDIWEVGVAYEVKPGGLEIVYAENSASKASGMGEAMAVKVAGWYNLGPGIRAVGNVFYAETDNNRQYDKDHKRNGIGFVSGLILEF